MTGHGPAVALQVRGHGRVLEPYRRSYYPEALVIPMV
jgi:hypothetical protein